MLQRTQTPFGDYLDVLLKERGVSLREFSREIGRSPGFICNVKRLTLNPKLIEPWADALKLNGDQRERFIKLAWLAHTPEYVRRLVESLEANQKGSPRRRRVSAHRR